MGLFNKKELNKIKELENQLNEYKTTLQVLGGTDYHNERLKIDSLINAQKQKYANIQKDVINLENKKRKIDDEIKESKEKLFYINDETYYQDFGIYTPQYDCMSSEEIAEKIQNCRKRQKEMIKNKTALHYSDNWQLDGSKQKGRALNNDNMKMVLRAFNNECDSIIEKVKFNNIQRIKAQIQKSAKAIDKLNSRNKISITSNYINCKIEELNLVYEYRLQKQNEKEKLREQRAEERELAKLQKEVESKRRELSKEKNHYENAKEQYLIQLSKCSKENENDIKEKINEINTHLLQLEKDLNDIDYRESNKRAGYVYIISNIGSFGKDVYKIGMTRRLNPQDRVDELGDASVPFKFDVHAMIFSDDAPTLENNLHKEFESKKINMINGRKEFFNVKLDEIKQAVKKYNENMIEIQDIPEAEQYRESIKLKEKLK